MRYLISTLLFFLLSTSINAQIGYQVSLLNSTTGEPRANEQVTCHVELTDKEEVTIWSQDINTTTNDFGVISLTVGNSSMFKDFKWAEKLPLYISVKVDDFLIGKSQILYVPLAEYSKESGVLTPEILCSNQLQKKGDYDVNKYSFKLDGTCSYSNTEKGVSSHANYTYFITGNDLVMSGTVHVNDHGDSSSYESFIFWRYYPLNNILLLVKDIGGW